ncbi:hypothetical protein BDN72DRAFT_965509 [Pluteus cervinus]|uniref:Uncharacterized protein n=1 Tax=Pluteus cervinus TaxID=181527 RepID=A0ACD3A5D1_9AGAR|nr:hypothetical protein BDN72DRAFT_965509 [Pluteus cervinus]
MPDPKPGDIQPVFPPEIEETIFSLCAQSGLKNCKNLTLVAKRVYEWLQPHLYKVAIVHNNRTYFEGPKFNRTLFKKYGQHVRQLLLWPLPSDDSYLHKTATCLSWCPNVVDLSFWQPDPGFGKILIDRLLSLPLQRLSFDITGFHKELMRWTISGTVSFASVTHLHLIGTSIKLREEEIKQYFPNVTHMALNGSMGLSHNSILDCWKDKLKVLIWHTYLSNSVSDDPRVVVMQPVWDYVGDWRDAREDGPKSVWRRAEVEVALRRRNAGL